MKILKGEYLFDKNGLHVLDDKGIAIAAEEDIECEIDVQHLERVKAIVTKSRADRGLDEEGNPVPEKSDEPEVSNSELESPTLEQENK